MNEETIEKDNKAGGLQKSIVVEDADSHQDSKSDDEVQKIEDDTPLAF